MKNTFTLIAIACGFVVGAGCASNNVNPATAHARTGYVDFYAVNDSELSWNINCVETDGSREKVFYEFDPLKENILRVAFKPGTYHLAVTLNNRPVPSPGMVEVDVKDGMVTPVQVTLVDAGTAQVLGKETSLGGTAYGRYGRRTKITGSESGLFRIQAEAGAALPYQIKAQMPYAAVAADAK